MLNSAQRFEKKKEKTHASIFIGAGIKRLVNGGKTSKSQSHNIQLPQMHYCLIKLSSERITNETLFVKYSFRTDKCLIVLMA